MRCSSLDRHITAPLTVGGGRLSSDPAPKHYAVRSVRLLLFAKLVVSHLRYIRARAKRSGSWLPATGAFRLFAALLLAVVTNASAQAQTNSPNVVQTGIANIEVQSIELSGFRPEMIGRSGAATLQARMFFWVELLSPESFGDETSIEPSRRELTESIQEIVSRILVVDRGRLGLLNLQFQGYRISGYDPEGRMRGVVLVEGEVVVPGVVVPFGSGVLGQTLIVSLELPGGISSSTATLRISGLTNTEKVAGIGAVAYFLIIVAFIYYKRYLRARRDLDSTEALVSEMRHDRQRREDFLSAVRGEGGLEPLEESVPEVPRALAEALAGGNLVLFFGAGLSTASGLPSWRDTVVDLGERFSSGLSTGMKRLIADAADSRRGDLGINDLSLLIEGLSSTFGRTAVEDVIAEHHAKDADVTTPYREIMSLPWLGVISLTWDNLGRKAFVDRRDDEPVKIFQPEDGPKFQEAIQQGKTFFVEALGGPQRRVLTLGEFRTQLERAPDFTRQLALLLDSKTLFFVGLGPQTLLEYLNAFGTGGSQKAERHFALLPYAAENELYEPLLRRQGVALLQYSSAESVDALLCFVRALKEEAAEIDRVLPDAGPGQIDRKLAMRRIEQLDLINIGPFESTSVTFDGSRSDGNWSVLVGPNGSGKSVLLRSIASALTPNAPDTQEAMASLLREGTSDGVITLTLGAQTLVINIYRDRQTVRVESGTRATPLEAGQILVLGFPAMRGAPAPDPNGPRPAPYNPPQPADVAPLVLDEVDPRMASFKQWLLNVLSQAGQGNPKQREIRDLLNNIVSELVPGDFDGFDKLDESQVLRLSRKVDGEVTTIPFRSVSQGMSSIFNWVGILIQRLYDFHSQSKAPHLEHAIVLIDEIDVHLHPDWQRRLVELTKKHFPNVQVIATTHSPLIASSLRRQEIRIIDPANGISVPWSETFGRPPDEIMQSDVGGLDKARPHSIERKMVEYGELVGLASPTQEQRRRREELLDELGEIGWHGAIERDADMEPPSAEELAEMIQKLKL